MTIFTIHHQFSSQKVFFSKYSVKKISQSMRQQILRKQDLSQNMLS